MVVTRSAGAVVAPAAWAAPEKPVPDRLSALVRVGAALARPLDVEGLFRAVYRELSRVLDTSIFIFGLHDEVNHMVHVVRQVYGGTEMAGVSFPLGSGFTSQAIRTRQARLIRRWSAEGPAIRVRYASGEGKTPESGLTVPLVWGDHVLAVMLVQSYEPDAYDEADLQLAQAVGSHVATALARLRGSERLDAQLQRRVSELETILASMNDGLMILDQDGCLVRLNPAARALLSVGDASIVLGKRLDGAQWDLWPAGPRAVAEALAPAAAAIRDGGSLDDVEVSLAGEQRILSFSCAPIHGLDGEPAGGVVVFHDVTGRAEVERLKDEVLSIASHDLKTPVAAIKARAQVMRRRMELGNASSAYLAGGLDAISDQSDRLVMLLDLLLDLSRLESGRLELSPVRCDLRALARGLMDDVELTSNRHRMRLEGPARLEGVWDAQRIEQVLRNLLTNAIKYSPDGGEIGVSLEEGQNGVVVRVRDQGVGLAAEECTRIFDRFYRSTAVRRLQGAGLGLYICQAIVAAHGGRIWAESAGAGRGSTFCFVLPRELPCGAGPFSATEVRREMRSGRGSGRASRLR